MMCINQCEKPLTIGFCRANKNRNVIPVSEDTDQSSPSVSDWLPLSVSFLAETHFDDLRGRRFLPLFKYSRVWFQCETRNTPPPPLTSAVALPPAPRMHWNIYAGLFLLQGISLPFLFLYYFWCNAVQIHGDESLINWNKVPVRRSLQALPYHLKPRRRRHLHVCFLH